MKLGVEYLGGVDDFFIRHHAPRREFTDLRTEFNIDARTINETYGKVYIAFSSGIDSQIIARCFIDQKLDAEYVFLHVPGCNDLELQHVEECEKFFNIKVTRYAIDLEAHKEEWLARCKNELVPSMHQYQFEWLCEQLPESYPVVTQGAMEPYVVGTNSRNVSIYRNKFEDMRQRFAFMEKHRTILDFPFSPEAIASYYTDSALKGFASSIQSFIENDLQKDGKSVSQSQLWNYYAKPIVKGQYFKDIIWYGKLTGYEIYPDWFMSNYDVKETRVAIPYWDLVDFLENNQNCHKDYKDWTFGARSAYSLKVSDEAQR
jgi:hypothetical protein